MATETYVRGDTLPLDVTLRQTDGTPPRIAPFFSGFNAAQPSVTPTVALSGPLRLDLSGVGAISNHKLIDATITGTFSGLTVTGLDPALDATVTVTASGVTLSLAAGTGQAVLA